MIQVLAIGNSFSEDATYYLHQIGQAAGVENRVANLYIGGCSLEQHWNNIEGSRQDYQLQLNGVKTDRYVSVQDMLREGDWDVIVTQQASHDSGWQDSYEPFLGQMVDYLRREAPKAKLYLHETWAYEKDSTHWNFPRYRRDQGEMFRRLTAAYEAASQRHGLPLIPCGELIQRLRETGYFPGGQGRSICRDGFHMDFIYGRYALGCLWAKLLFGISPEEDTFVPRVDFMSCPPADPEILDLIRRTV